MSDTAYSAMRCYISQLYYGWFRKELRNNFNHIAGFYDLLKKLVYGNSTVNAERVHLSSIPLNAHVVIVGGGSGEILEYLDSSLKVDYFEPSVVMINKAKRRNFSCQVNFIKGFHSNLDRPYDVVITNFFLDLFEYNELTETIDFLSQKVNCQWIVTDFDKANTKSFWSGLLEWTMYRFFKVTTSIGASRFYAFEDLVRSTNRFSLQGKKSFYRGFITSWLWRKSD